MSASQRRKGAGGEREVCTILTQHYGRKVERNITQARDGGTDIVLDPFSIEVKRRAKIANLEEWMHQAEAADTHRTPVVMCRADGGRWFAVMRIDDWAMLAREEVSAPKGDL